MAGEKGQQAPSNALSTDMNNPRSIRPEVVVAGIFDLQTVLHLLHGGGQLVA